MYKTTLSALMALLVSFLVLPTASAVGVDDFKWMADCKGRTSPYICGASGEPASLQEFADRAAALGYDTEWFLKANNLPPDTDLSTQVEA